MPIQPGTRLGPSEILSDIGAGAMGEVNKARDTRLNRIVAIKGLPAHHADRSESRERDVMYDFRVLWQSSRSSKLL
jgi:eukaryotic-like serine/threonine-protein kinase